MNATLEIPAEIYRQLEERSAVEGRPVIEVAAELLRMSLQASPTTKNHSMTVANDPSAPWLEITRRYVRPGMNHELDAIEEATEVAWQAEVADKLVRFQ
ncbi:MAG: hypothetical protein ACO1QR_10025 [Chthoniobacteraceae bacterium]